jgi:hypothetical protein
MNELAAVKAGSRRSNGKNMCQSIDTGRMVEIVRARHISSDHRFQKAEKNCHMEEKAHILTALGQLRSGESHSFILGTSPSATAVMTAIMLEKLELRSGFQGGLMTAEEAIETLQPKPGAACHPIMSRFRCLKALLEAGIVQPNFTDRTIKPTMSIPSTRDVFSLVSEKTGVTVARMKSPERSNEVVRARFLAIFILRHVCVLTLPQIGVIIGGRDHTTVLNSLNQTRQTVFSDVAEAFWILELCNLIDLVGQKRYCEFLEAQIAAQPRDADGDEDRPRRLTMMVPEARLEYRRA